MIIVVQNSNFFEDEYVAYNTNTKKLISIDYSEIEILKFCNVDYVKFDNENDNIDIIQLCWNREDYFSNYKIEDLVESIMIRYNRLKECKLI